jgi:hypothetical protein
LLVVDLTAERWYDSAVPGKSLDYQHLKVHAALAAVLAFGLSVLCSALSAQTPKPSLPDPLKFLDKRDLVMRASRAVLEQLGYQIELEDQPGGRLVTRPYEFVSGALTSSEVDKIGIKNDTITGSWLRARYTVEALFEVVSPTETLLTVRTKMEALNRDTNGTQKWMPVQSLGSVEKRILGKISMKLLGTEPAFKDNKGFWDKKPVPVPPVKKQSSA